MLKFDKISTDVICLSVTTVQALLHAPTGATEIYLYAQLHGTAELETLCREFDLSDEQVRDAINFLRNERLLRIAHVSASFDDEDAEQIDELPAQDAQPTAKPRRILKSRKRPRRIACAKLRARPADRTGSSRQADRLFRR